MVTVSFKQICLTLLSVTAFALVQVQPLGADENSGTPSNTTQEQESVFQTLKRKTRALFGSDSQTKNTQNETSRPAEKNPEEETAPQETPGRKAIDSLKKGMNKISDNISDSVERDKKTLKKKFDKLDD